MKWVKEKYTDIELDTNEPTELFKAQLMALTGVEPDRQKVILKGKTLKDSWDDFKGIKDVSKFILGYLFEARIKKTDRLRSDL